MRTVEHLILNVYQNHEKYIQYVKSFNFKSKLENGRKILRS